MRSVTPGTEPESFRLALAITILVSGPLAFGAVEPWAQAGLQALIWALLWAEAVRHGPGASSAVWTVLVCQALIIVLGAAQLAGSSNPLGPRAVLPATVFAYGTWSAALHSLSMLAFIWAVCSLARSPKARWALAWAIFTVGTLIAVIGLMQRAVGDYKMYGLRAIPTDRHPSSYFGPFYNRDHAAALMSMAALIGMGLLTALVRSPTSESLGHRADALAKRALTSLALVILCAAVVRTGSRGGAIAFGFAVCVAGWTAAASWSRWTRTSCRAGILLAAATVCVVVASNGVNSSFTTSVQQRAAMARGGIRLISDFAGFGAGLGSLIEAYPPYKESMVLGVVDHLHNDWLELLAVSGATGFSAWVLGLGAYFRRAREELVSCRDDERCLRVAALAAAAGFLLHGLFDFSFQIPANALTFFACLAIAGAQAGVPPPSAAASRSRLLSLRAAAVLLAALSLRPAVGWWFDSRAAEAALDEKPRLWGIAYRWDANPRYLYRKAKATLQLSEVDRAQERPLLRDALTWSSLALERAPANRDYLTLQSELLRRLGRGQDAADLLPPGVA